MDFPAKIPAVYHELTKLKPNVSVGSSHGVSLSLSTQDSLFTERGGSHAAAYPAPPQSPKTNKVSDTDQAPVGAPVPAFVRAPGHNANCDQEAASLIKHWDTSVQLLHSHCWWTLAERFLMWGRMCWMLTILVLVNIQTHMPHLRCIGHYTEANKGFSRLYLICQRGEHTRSQLKAVEREYQTRTFPLKHRANWGIREPL